MKMVRKLEWDESLSTGIEDIDEQHRYFIKCLQNINEALAVGDKHVLKEEMDFMDHYAHWHFGVEEKYMRIYNYPKFDEHRREHLKFYEVTKRVIEKLSRDVVMNPRELSYEINRYLIDWFILHIKGTDRQFANFLNENNLTLPSEKIPEEFKI